MFKYLRGFGVLIAGIMLISISACATCGTSYRSELTDKPGLEEAEVSYHKALYWIGKGDCALRAPKAREAYLTADSYLSDTIYKLKEAALEKKIDVDNEVYYCEKIQRETHAKEGIIRKEMMPPEEGSTFR